MLFTAHSKFDFRGRAVLCRIFIQLLLWLQLIKLLQHTFDESFFTSSLIFRKKAFFRQRILLKKLAGFNKNDIQLFLYYKSHKFIIAPYYNIYYFISAEGCIFHYYVNKSLFFWIEHFTPFCYAIYDKSHSGYICKVVIHVELFNWHRNKIIYEKLSQCRH